MTKREYLLKKKTVSYFYLMKYMYRGNYIVA